MDRPNILFVMTDQERYPPPYETEAARAYRRAKLPARERVRTTGVDFRRHYTAATACAPSRASLFTGQYPSLHGVRSTDGLAKGAFDPAMVWLDPDTVPTMGDWFRAAGYRTEYRGKWHISHANLPVAGAHVALQTNDRDGDGDGNVLAEVADAYRRVDRLADFGFCWLDRTRATRRRPGGHRLRLRRVARRPGHRAVPHAARRAVDGPASRTPDRTEPRRGGDAERGPVVAVGGA